MSFYESKARVEKIEGTHRRVTLETGDAFDTGVHGAIKAHYKLEHEKDLPLPVDYLVGATGAWMLGTLNGGLEARGVKLSGSDLRADVVGENEVRDGLPVLTRIVVNYVLRIPSGTREAVERALSRHMEKCPTAASLRGAVEVAFTADIDEVWMDCRKLVFAFAAIALIEYAFELPMLSAQPVELRAGQEVRAYNDSLHTVISGRVLRVSANTLALIRYPDAPPTTIHWTDIHRLEVNSQGVWIPLALARDPELLGDSTEAAGALAGAAAGRSSKEASFFLPALLAAAPLGFFGLFAFCSDCSNEPKVVAGVSVTAMVMISGRARAKAKEFPGARESEIQEKPAAYQAAYREAYTAAFSAKLQKQVVGGSLIGILAGLTALGFAFATYGGGT